MAQFKLTEWKKFSSPYNVIVELEKHWPIMARPAGESYMIMTEDQEIALKLRELKTLNNKPLKLEEMIPGPKLCVFIVMGVPTDVPAETVEARIQGATKSQRQTKFDPMRKRPYFTHQ